MKKLETAVVEKGNGQKKKYAILSFTLMAIEADIKISLQEFDGSAGCDFLKIHPSLAGSQPLTSHATDVQKRLRG
jgi:hypothetical protein